MVKILAKVIIYMYKYQKYIHINSLKCTIKNKINVIHIEMIGFWWTLKQLEMFFGKKNDCS